MTKLCLLSLFFLLSLSLEAAEGVVLYPRTTGSFRTNFKQMVDGGESRPIRIPIPFYVIRHPQGIVLFDSGLGQDYPEQVRGWWLNRLFEFLLPSEFRPSDAAVAQLQQMGIPPESVRYVVASHLHFDHAGGLKDFPGASVIVNRKEWENADVGRWRARFRGIMKEQLEGVASRLQIVDYQAGTALGPFAASLDLFGDGTLILLSTPGHTPGHQSLLVTLASGKKVLLTGDAVWLRENYLRPAPKGWLIRTLEENGDAAWATTLRIRRFSEENPDVLIIPGHDPELWERLLREIR